MVVPVLDISDAKNIYPKEDLMAETVDEEVMYI
jgi:hypothetical protein